MIDTYNSPIRHRVRVLLMAGMILAGLVIGFVPSATIARAAPESPAQTAPAVVYRFGGGGWGHGIGMSQYGACGMAAAGSTRLQILAHYYRGTAVQDLGQPAGIRVRVVASASRLSFTPQVVALTLHLNGRGFLTVGAGETVNVALISGGYVIEGRSGPIPSSAVLSLPLPGGQRPVRLTPPNHRYDRGTVVVRRVGAALQASVDGLDMQGYLYGLAEVPDSWPAAALQSQAIAGRTYAKNVIDRRRAADPSRTWDIDGTVLDQAYGGFDKEATSPNWLNAVNGTLNDTITYGGAAIQAFYSSASGGHTENNEYVWGGTPLPYLRGVPDPTDSGCGNPRHSWVRTYSTAELSRWLGRFADTSVGTVQQISLMPPFGVSGRVDQAAVRLVGSAGTKQVTGGRFRQVVNSGLAAEGRGLDHQLLSTKFGGNSDPIGFIDQVSQSPAGVRIVGWVFDPNTDASTEAHVFFGTQARAVLANLPRADVQARYGLASPNHGFDVTLVPPDGLSRMCVYGFNVGPGASSLLGPCRMVPGGSPFGSLDSIRRAPGGIRLAGWAIDPNTASPISMHVYRGSQLLGGGPANVVRSDVGRAYPGFGSNHGFDFAVPAPAGSYTVCAFGINVGLGSNRSVGCRATTVTTNPFGSIDRLRLESGRVRATGWAIDPDTAAAIAVHVYVYAPGRTIGPYVLTASATRSDIGRLYPDYGPNHGFDALLGAASPGWRACVIAMNAASGVNVQLGCRTL